MKAHFSSFKAFESVREGIAFSAAVYQPKWLTPYPKAEWADIRDATGRWTRPREFVEYLDPLRAYRDALWGLYLAREDSIRAFVNDHEDDRVTFLCWCPYDAAAQQQLRAWGTFVCHTEVMRLFLAIRFGVQTTIDEDRWEMKELGEPDGGLL